MITASIVTYRTHPLEVERALRLASQSAISRLWVIDNGSDPRIRKLCDGTAPSVCYIASDNVGYGTAHNKAIRAAAAEGSRYHIVMNTDILYNPADIAKIAAYMDSDPTIASVQPCIKSDDGSMQYTVRMLPTPMDVFGRRFLPRKWIRRRDDRYLLKHIDHSRPFNAPYHQGSFMFLRMSSVSRIGGFDERFFLYPEDIDLTRRLHAIGKTMYWPGVEITHSHQAGSYHSLRLLRIHCVNMAKYFNKWGWWTDPLRDLYNSSLR